MIKTVTIVSLSRGIMGESFVQHEVEIGLKRLKDDGLHVKCSKHSMDGLEVLKEHPEYRAQDLLDAFQDPETDMILCAIGGDDTYRLLPYLFEHDELASAVSDKMFLGFSDTTMNHLMLHKVGLKTFYGQAFLPDICEIGPQMLPYTRAYFEELITTGTIHEIRPSEVWYKSRSDFSVDAVGTAMNSYPDKGFELLQGQSVFSGEILGGCIDTLYDIFNNARYSDSVELCSKYELFPDMKDWEGKILLLESSEETAVPDKYRSMLMSLKKTGIFDVISGVIIGKPADEKYHEEYKKLLLDVIDDPNLPIVANINVGHATPRCIIPFGVPAVVDTEQQVIRFG